MKSLLLEEHVDKLVVASDVADLSYPVVTADLSLAETLPNFETEGVRFLPVVDEENMLIGLLDRQEVMKLLKKQIFDRTAGTEYLGTSRWRKAVESD